MWRYVDYLTAGCKVAYDKVSDYVYPNLDSDLTEDSENSDENMDSIIDYTSVIEVEKYMGGEAKGDKRILPPVGYYEEYSVFFSQPTHIIDNLYLGSAFNAAAYQTLRDLDIKVVINVSKEITNYYDGEYIYHRYNLYDNNKHSIVKHLKQAYNDILYHQKNTSGNILVHCYMGASRSASVIIYYLMKHKKHDNGNLYTFDDALKYIHDKRSIINPTFRLIKDLAKAKLNE
jgi:protein-tyrosine phosphatase